MRLLFLGAFALLIANGLQKGEDSGLLEHPSIQFLEPNDVGKNGCTKELYQPKFQLPVPRVYDGVHNSLEYTRATGTEEEFKRVLKWQEKFLKEIIEEKHKDDPKIGEEMYKEYVTLSKDKEKYDQLVKFVKPYIQPLKTALKNAEGGEMKMKPGEPVKRPCYKTDGKVCIIDVSEIHVTYNPKWVIGYHLLTGYLLSTHWIKPDFDDVKKYAGLWHTDNKEDLLVHHESKDDKKRIINRCSFFGKYQLDENGFPLNPVARTGFTGRGELYQWGPSTGVGAILYIYNETTNEFKFLAIMNGKHEILKDRRYTTPGGYVDPGEQFEDAAKRELIEEGLNHKNIKKEKEAEVEQLKVLMGKGEIVYYGYSDAKGNNTDNAWNESITYAFEIKPENLKEFGAENGSDAVKAMWMTIEIDKDSDEVKSLLINNKEDSEVEKEDQTVEDMQIEESEEKSGLEREKKLKACWVEKVKGKTEEEKTETVKECLKLNDKNMINMDNIARFLLVKIYKEVSFLKYLEKQHLNQGKYQVKATKASTSLAGTEKRHHEEGGEGAHQGEKVHHGLGGHHGVAGQQGGGDHHGGGQQGGKHHKDLGRKNPRHGSPRSPKGN
uniref:Nudix hydrolase domain-containing protein n=2 Tax=Meloidogyne TaxID=189290 RepID=A0A915PDB3_9BILA